MTSAVSQKYLSDETKIYISMNRVPRVVYRIFWGFFKILIIPTHGRYYGRNLQASPLNDSLLSHVPCSVASPCPLGFNLEELRRLPRVFMYILNVCKFCIWLARNDFRFRSLQPGAIPVIENVKARVKFHLTVLFKHQKTSRGRRFFTRRWGANGVIASFAGGNLTFAL